MWRIVSMLTIVCLIAIPAYAKPNKGKKYKKAQKTAIEQQAMESGEKFSPAERNLIRAQILGHQDDGKSKKKGFKNLPPGLQKKVARGKELPPGWQKKVAPGESLDYQVYRQGENLSDDLLRRLPPPPVGSEILRVEDQIIRLNSATRTILDVFDLNPAN